MRVLTREVEPFTPVLVSISRRMRSRRGMTDVMKTIIFVVVTVNFAVSVSYLMTNIASDRIALEKVDVFSQRCDWDAPNDRWDITIQIRNIGTKDITLIGMYVNGFEVDNYDRSDPGEGETSTDMLQTQTIRCGVTHTIHLYIDGPGGGDGWRTLSSGTSINVKIHTASGMDYSVPLSVV